MTTGWTTVGELYRRQDNREQDGRFAANPFKDRNATKISQAIKRDPTEARRLCEAAGDNWRRWVPYDDTVAGAEERRREYAEKVRRNFG
jgi:hypothetical protein